MTTQPPAEGFETKDYPGAIPGRPGYQLADQPPPEHGPNGIQYGYSNSEGPEGDDGTSVFDRATGLTTSPGGGETEGGASDTADDGDSSKSGTSATKRTASSAKTSSGSK